MSSIQNVSRRQSARLQQKEDHGPPASATVTNGQHVVASSTSTTSRSQTAERNVKKRKKNYDEEDDGFAFSRVKAKKPRQSVSASLDAPVQSLAPASAQPKTVKEAVRPTDSDPKKKETAGAKGEPEVQPDPVEAPPKKRQKRRMSFSTPGSKEPQPVRRSKRLSTDAQPEPGSPSMKAPQQLRPPKARKEKSERQKQPARSHHESPARQLPPQVQASEPMPPADESHSATKIALPFADTPVISRNKAMREGKSGKSERRSSLGLRGRRASSLIDSGTSNGKLGNLIPLSLLMLTNPSSSTPTSRMPGLLQAHRK